MAPTTATNTAHVDAAGAKKKKTSLTSFPKIIPNIRVLLRLKPRNSDGSDAYESTSYVKNSMSGIRKFAAETWMEDALEALKMLLASSPEKRRYFQEYIDKEYSGNNLAFYDAVNDLIATARGALGASTSDSEPVMVPFANAKAVYERFILAGSEQQVNLTSHRTFVASFNNDPKQEWVDAQFLIKAQREILKLMALDTYPRFLKSKQCQQMLMEFNNPNGKKGGNNLTKRKSSKVAIADPGAPRTLEDLLRSNKDELSLPADISNSNVNRDSVLHPAAAKWLLQFAAIADFLPCCIVISDLQTPGVPIAFANRAFCETSGYAREEIVGQNCRFLQGPKTDLGAVELLRRAIRNGREIHIQLLNYRKDGTTFRNFLSMKPVWDSDVDLALAQRPALDTSNLGKFPAPVNPDDVECEEVHPKIIKKHLLFFVGVQYELPETRSIEPKVLQHGALLKLLPTIVPKN